MEVTGRGALCLNSRIQEAVKGQARPRWLMVRGPEEMKLGGDGARPAAALPGLPAEALGHFSHVQDHSCVLGCFSWQHGRSEPGRVVLRVGRLR